MGLFSTFLIWTAPTRQAQCVRPQPAGGQEDGWWAHKGSNLGPLPCEGNALPLSYAPGTIMPTAGLSAGRRIGARDLEVRAEGVKFPGALGPENLAGSCNSPGRPPFRPAYAPCWRAREA